ncbi:MAG: hypothetical protein KA112_02695 [Alphaproteobacteria bacterium]|nr:hypothetical protein [Alphaproteobacteria bacterium]MBP7729511.1 hypothetical protein [Alphaproteobacteria bacterium]
MKPGLWKRKNRMGRSTPSSLIPLTEEGRKILMEQYKLLLESINKLNDVRETANNFWITINGALIGMIAYIRDAESMGGDQKPFLLFTVLFFGFVLTLSWLSSLASIKKNIEIRNDLTIELEKYLPAKIFTLLMRKTGRKENWSSMVLKEMFVPLSFLIGYIFFAALLCISPRTLVPC